MKLTFEELESDIRRILKGIDLCSGHRIPGVEEWWETSAQAEFGKKKLDELLEYLKMCVVDSEKEKVEKFFKDYSNRVKMCVDNEEIEITEHINSERFKGNVLIVDSSDREREVLKEALQQRLGESTPIVISCPTGLFDKPVIEEFPIIERMELAEYKSGKGQRRERRKQQRKINKRK